jgi:predicted amidophosphoribosyltransferase
LKQLVRKKGYTKSQTKLDRFGRWDNVQEIFRSTELLQSSSHVLIVDDVITTGATLEALVRAIQVVNPEIQISLLSFAFTK